jgi:hypothetical protein
MLPGKEDIEERKKDDREGCKLDITAHFCTRRHQGERETMSKPITRKTSKTDENLEIRKTVRQTDRQIEKKLNVSKHADYLDGSPYL